MEKFNALKAVVSGDISSIRCWMLFVLTFVLFSAKGQEVGVNFNGQFNHIDYNDLERTKTTWVRGFIDFFEFYNDPSKLDTDERIKKYLTLKDNGYKTILNIKWQYKGKAFPEVGSQEMDDQKAFLAKIYDKVWAKTDIIIVGNEPFIESRKEDHTANGPLVKFYRQMCIKTKNYRVGKKDVPIYVGAFDNLYLDSKRITAVEELHAFAKNHDYMAGVDVHIHHSGIKQINSVFDYVVPKIRSNQKILVTEYSLMKHWRTKMSEEIPSSFAGQYGYSPGMKNYEYIDFALKNPRSRPEWVDFLKQSYWFENRKYYIQNSYDRFKSYSKFHIATYAIRQSFPFNKDFTANTDPWVINPLYVNRTVEPNPTTGYNQFNYAFIDDFRNIQNSGSSARVTSVNELPTDENGAAEILIYPNPVTNYVQIINRPEGAKITVKDMQGKLLGVFDSDEISFTGLSSGLYILTVSGQNKNFQVLKK